MGIVKVKEVFEHAYQNDDPSPSRIVVDTDISSNLCFISREVDIIELLRQYSMSQSNERGANIKDEDEQEEFDDNVKTESDENNPQLSD